MATLYTQIPAGGAGASDYGDLRPSPELRAVTDMPSTLALWDIENGRSGGLADFKWKDRLAEKSFQIDQLVPAPIEPPVFVPDQVNGRGALAFGDASVGGGTPAARNGSLKEPTIRDVSSPLSLCVLARGNAVNTGTLIAVGGDGGEITLLHHSTGDVRVLIGSDLQASSNSSYPASSLFLAILSWEPSTGRLAMSVNGGDLVDNTAVEVPINGPIRLGSTRTLSGAQTRALIEGRVAALSYHDIALHAVGNEGELAKVLAYYNEYRGA